MNAPSDLTRWTAAQMAAAVAAGEVSAVELTEAHLARIARTDIQVRAFLHVAGDAALAAARAVDARRAAGEPLGPLAGVPLALKDVFTTIDMPTTCGSKILAGWQPPYGIAGAVQNKVTDSTMAEHLSLAASAGHACGIDFKAAEHLRKHPEFAWQKDLLRDMNSHPWATFSAGN